MNILISCGAKADAVTVDVAKLGLTESAMENPALRYVVEYGLKQSLNDAIAGVKVDAPDYNRANATALVLKRLDAIMAGNVRQPGTREASDPIGVEAKKLARAALMADDQKRKAAMTAVRQAGNAGKDAEIIALIVGKMAENAVWRDAAEKSIAAKKAAVADAGDLGDMLASLFAPTE